MKRQKNNPILPYELTIQVRFSEVDALKMVWHGNYIKYLEDAREAWGKKYHLGYLDMYDHGFVAPIYDIHICHTCLQHGNGQVSFQLLRFSSQTNLQFVCILGHSWFIGTSRLQRLSTI